MKFQSIQFILLGSVPIAALLGYILHLHPWLRVSSCRCRPDEPCWPSPEQWAALNDSINGHLVRLSPIGRVCHEPFYDETACTEVRRLAGDTGWRASQPGIVAPREHTCLTLSLLNGIYLGALQNWLWESGLGVNESCFVHADPLSPCQQARIPLYSAAVESVQEIQQTVRFAAQFNLRVVIRNTGHDMAGRSGGADALQIHTHRLQEVTFHDAFVPHGSNGSLGRAVSVGAGVVMGELYRRCALQGVTVVGGDCPTVGAAGGYLQGGGVSPFFALQAGLAVDNVFEFEVISANGDAVVANAFHNQDLFWALRGGGGGTFGVVARATLRTYTDVPVVLSELTVRDIETNTPRWERALAVMFEALQAYNRNGVGGQLVASALDASKVRATVTMYELGETDPVAAEDRIRAYSVLLSASGIHGTFSSRALAKVTSSYRHAPDVLPLDHAMVAGSVALSNALFNSSGGPAQIAARLSKMPLRSGDLLFTSNLGGRVMATTGTDTAMHPAWRQSAQLVTYVGSVGPSLEDKLASLRRLSAVYMPHLYGVDPGSPISYVNVGDPGEPDFQGAYWGPNYKRLLEIKREWDPEDLFICRQGVGSENWDAEGMCRGGSWMSIFG
ncbi:chanoclavine-I synthase oxidoreductase protein [Aspergillus unguis]